MAAYHDDKDLKNFPRMGEHSHDHWKRFMEYYSKAFQDGLVSRREKLLIGFAVAQVEQCPYCIDSYTRQCLEAGLTMEHLAEVLHCAASLRAGITLAHGLVARNVVEKLGM